MTRSRLRYAVLATCAVVAVTAFPPLTPAQQLPQPVVGEPGALIANGGFDVGDRAAHPINFSVEGNEAGANVVNLQAWRIAGLGSLEINDTAGSNVSVRTERIVAVPDGDYTLTAQLRGESGTPAWLYLEFWDYNGQRITETHASPAYSDAWQTVTVRATAPANAAHITALIYGSLDAAGVSYWDELDVKLSPKAYDEQLGTQRELFLNDYRIESAHDVGRVVHPAKTTAQPVLRPTKPWEHSTYIYGSVYRIGGVYRMWYTCYNDQPPNYHLCYAESQNGIDWTKPLGRGSVGYQDIPASQTNIVFAGGGTIAYNPDAPADRRYALMSFRTGVANDTLGYYVWFSPDGYTWTQGPEKPVLLDGDVSNVTYDTATHRYIATIKKRMFTSRTPGTYERTAFVSTSTDFVNWTQPSIGVSGDYADDGYAESLGGLEGQVYGMPVAPYESTYLGFPWMFSILDFTSGQYKSAADGPVDVQVASSRDLTRWPRPVRDPVIEPGLPGAWNDGAHYTASNMLVTNDSIRMYYGAFNNGHGGADPSDPNRDNHVGQVGLATWRRDGFVSLSNGAVGDLGDAGEVTTKPIVFAGADLRVNAVVRSGGYLRVEALSADGETIPGFTAAQCDPVRGDQLAATVTWANGKRLGDLAGQRVKLRFQLTNADLYSYWVAPAT